MDWRAETVPEGRAGANGIAALLVGNGDLRSGGQGLAGEDQAGGDISVGEGHAGPQVNAAVPQPGTAGAADSGLAGVRWSASARPNGVQQRLPSIHRHGQG